MSKYYIGVDGGGTKTEFILANEKGELLADVIKSTSHFLTVGFDGLKKVLQEGIEECVKQANINRNEVKYCAVCTCGFGDVDKHDSLIIEATDLALDDISHQVFSDTYNAHRGSLASKAGIHVIAGTGSIAFGIDEDNKTKRVGGWHHLLGGDEASGYWLAREMLKAYCRESDGREEKSELYYYLKEKYNLVNDNDIVDYTVVNLNFERNKIASLSKDLYQLALRNDPQALKIYDDAAQQLYELIVACSKGMNFKEEIPVSYSGGVFNGKEVILNPLRKRLENTRFVLTEPKYDPAIGSLIVAYTQANLTITEEILNNFNKLQNKRAKN